MASVPLGDGDASSDEIRIAFTLTKADYLRAYRRSFWRTLWWLILSAPLIATSPVWRDPYFRFCFMHGYFSGPTIVGALLIAAAIVFFFSLPELLARWYTRRIFRATPLAGQCQELTFTSNGVEVVTPLSRGELAWSGFQKATKSAWAFQLYLGPTHYVLIPFDRLDSGEIKIRLHRLLKGSLGARASKI